MSGPPRGRGCRIAGTRAAGIPLVYSLIGAPRSACGPQLPRMVVLARVGVAAQKADYSNAH